MLKMQSQMLVKGHPYRGPVSTGPYRMGICSALEALLDMPSPFLLLLLLAAKELVWHEAWRKLRQPHLQGFVRTVLVARMEMAEESVIQVGCQVDRGIDNKRVSGPDSCRRRLSEKYGASNGMEITNPARVVTDVIEPPPP